MESTCVFCRIVRGEIPSRKEKETDDFIVIHDINPQAPVHLLLIPKQHLTDLRDLPFDLWSKLKDLVVELGKEYKAYRLVHNVGEAALVKHAHFHLLGNISVDRKV